MPPKKAKSAGYPAAAAPAPAKSAPTKAAPAKAPPPSKKGAGGAAPPAGGSKSEEKLAGGGCKKEEKASKKQDRDAEAAARQKAIDAMLNPPSDDDETSSAEEEGEGGGGADPAALREQRKEEKEAEERTRQAARERRSLLLEEQERERREKEQLRDERLRARAKKLQEVEGAVQVDGAASTGPGSSQLALVLQKVATGSKLSNKEQRLYDKHRQEDEERQKQELAKEHAAAVAGQPTAERWIAELDAFSLSMAEDSGTAAGGTVDAHLERFTIGAGAVHLFEDASLTLASSRRYGLLGPNGQGKTTLLKFLASRRLPIPAHWSVTLVEQEARATSRRVVDAVLEADTRRSQLLADEEKLLRQIEGAEDGNESARTLEDMCSCLDAVGKELEASGAEAAEAKVRQILCGLGFTAAMMDGPVEVLSGGWRMRVSLAQALFMEPDLLLLDEPTNHLDLEAVFWLDEYLSEYKKTLLVVSHDADFLDSVCTDVIHLEERKLHQYRGGYTQFTKAHEQRMKEREAAYKKQQKEIAKAKACNKKPASKAPEELLTKPKDYIVKFAFLPPDEDEMVGIGVHDACFSYTGRKPWLLRDLNFRVDTSSRIAVVGPNGAGKSTLLSLLGKAIEPCAGEVEHTRRLVVGRFSQHFDEISPYLHMTAVEFLTSPELRRAGAGVGSPDKAHECLGRFGLPGHGHTRPMGELSGGQKARVCFASITCRRPQVLILDEPTNHLDIESVEALIAALKRYKGGLILVSHDVNLIKAAECDLWVCKGEGQDVAKLSSFEQYRREVLRDLAKRQAAEEAQAQARVEARRKKRQEATARRGGRGGAPNP